MHDFSVQSYIVASFAEDSDNCLRSENENIEIWTTDMCPDERLIELKERLWEDKIDGTVFDFTQSLDARDLDLRYLDG